MTTLARLILATLALFLLLGGVLLFVPALAWAAYERSRRNRTFRTEAEWVNFEAGDQ